MKRALSCATVLTIPMLFAAPATAATTTPAGYGTGSGAPDAITTTHVPLSLYAEVDDPNAMGWVLAGADRTNAFVLFSQTIFRPDGSSSRIDVQATAPARALSTSGNLSSVTLAATPVQVTRTQCPADGGSCSDTTSTESLALTATATGPITAMHGSEYSRVTEAGKTIVAGETKTRPGTVTLQVGDTTWSATDDGWATTFVQLADSSMAYIDRNGPFTAG
ncbi:MAG: hypothetical protein ABR549_05400 [Mycobacteriales bacterium]